MWWSDKKIISASLLLAILIAWPVSYADLFRRAENWISDYVQIIWGERADFSDVVIIDVDETSMRALNSQLGAWPYDRQVFAATVDYLEQAGADQIVFDILFTDVRNGDKEFAEQLAAADNVYLASVLLHDYRFIEDQDDKLLGEHVWSVESPPVLKRKGLMLPHPEFLKRANIGVISVFPDPDGVVRRLPLVVKANGQYFSSMMLSLLSGYKDRSISFDWSNNIAEHGNYRWPVSEKGAVTIKYPSNFTDLSVIPFYEFLLSAHGAGNIEPDTYRGKTVFIGSTASILGDYTYIPRQGSGRVHGLGVLALAYHSLKHDSLLISDSVPANASILLIIVLILAIAIRFKGLRAIPLISAYGIAIVLSFSHMVLLYMSLNVQTWILMPVVAATLFVFIAIFAKSLSLQLEGQRLVYEKQAAEESRDLKARFLAHMTHELRTPLTAIMGYNKLLIDKEVDPDEEANYLQVIEKNSEHLLLLINNVLDQSQIEAGQIRLVKGDYDIRDLLQDVTLLLRPVADNKAVELQTSVNDQVPKLLNIDRMRMKQVVINLVGNALKFIEQGHILIEAGWQNNRLSIAVEDTGPGIPEKDLQNIFESFQQVDSVIASDITGTGLGLTISTNLARLMGGQITVESELGHGARFTLSIDAEEGEVEDVDLPSQETSDNVKISGYVLLAEDSKDSSKLITLFLEIAGFEVKLAENGQQAYEMAIAEPPAIILMDMHMPIMDGQTATQKIREAGFEGPIFALTASNDQVVIGNMRGAGCNGEIAKPVDTDQLIQTVSQYLSQ